MSNRIIRIISSAAFVFAGACAALGADYDLAAYVWPAYHAEPRWAELGIFKDGKGEWQNVYEAVKHYPDDYWGVKPLWGYEMEDDPVAVARKIDAATAAGVNVFIYDWYWYGGRPFLEGALDNGFLKAKNCERMKFYVMWANHDVTGLWNNKLSGEEKGKKIWSAKITDEDWVKIVARWIGYFRKPNYYTIGGEPVVSIYKIAYFADWEGVAKANARLDYLRAEARKAGFPGVHIQAVAAFMPPENLKVDSTTFYNWGYHTWAELGNREHELTYRAWGELSMKNFDVARAEAEKVGAAFFPNITCGWDTNARYPKGASEPFVHGSTPELFEEFCRRTKAWADAHPAKGMPRLITINSWNEWTEGTYLEPDDHFGYGYLNALWRVFKSK